MTMVKWLSAVCMLILIRSLLLPLVSLATVSGATYDAPCVDTMAPTTTSEHTIPSETINLSGMSLRGMAVGQVRSILALSQILNVPKTTVLGENMTKRVIPFAEKTNARTLPFGTTADEWAKLSPRQRWKLNDGALRTRIGEGDSFRYIGPDPYRNPALRQQFDLTGSELLRLQDRGIPFQTVAPDAVQSILGRP